MIEEVDVGVPSPHLLLLEKQKTFKVDSAIECSWILGKTWENSGNSGKCRQAENVNT